MSERSPNTTPGTNKIDANISLSGEAFRPATSPIVGRGKLEPEKTTQFSFADTADSGLLHKLTAL